MANPATGSIQIRVETQLVCQKICIVANRIGLAIIRLEVGYQCFVLEFLEDTRKTITDTRVKSIDRIPYSGYVYDLTTENHHFAAGIGNLIVHNTDSIYCNFPSIPSSKLWEFALQIEQEFTSLFPSPMKLAFEEKIYKRFLILTKKRYMAFTQNSDLTIDKLLTIRGVLLARRDNCKWIREIYEKTVRRLMDLARPCPSLSEIELLLQEEMIRLCSHFYDTSFITITKSVGSEYKKKVVVGFDEATGKITDMTKFKKRLSELEISPKDPNWLQLYQKRMTPAHAQLAYKMADRGCPVSAGTRIEYLMIRHANPRAKQFQKIEDPEYQKQFSDVLRLDFFYVLQLAKNSLQQLITVVYKDDGIVDRLIDLHIKKATVMRELEGLFQPVLVFSGM
jgi:DNA polymerase elongation subunit (family B)